MERKRNKSYAILRVVTMYVENRVTSRKVLSRFLEAERVAVTASRKYSRILPRDAALVLSADRAVSRFYDSFTARN